jgi:hypothetical protein
MFESFSSRPSSFVIRGAVSAAVAGALTLGAHAQQSAQPTPGTTTAPAPLVASLTTRPMDLASLAGVNYSSSSDSLSPGDATAADPGTLNFLGTTSAMQPPPRRRYGRPRYNDSSHNSDGSSKYVFEAAAGLTLPLGDTYRYFNTGYAFQVGGGRQFNNKFAVLLQFDYDHFGINKNTLDSQAALYNGENSTTGIAGCGPGQGESGCALPVDGSNHVWSFTLNPTYTFLSGDKYGAYVVLGAGYYHKVTDFTTPETGYYDTGFYVIPVTENAVFDHYTSNAFGGNLGFGLTYKFSRFADERLFIEARYVVIDNAQRQGYTFAENTSGYVATGPNPDPNNAFPANSNKTTYVPIKVGIRF